MHLLCFNIYIYIYIYIILFIYFFLKEAFCYFFFLRNNLTIKHTHIITLFHQIQMYYLSQFPKKHIIIGTSELYCFVVNLFERKCIQEDVYYDFPLSSQRI